MATKAKAKKVTLPKEVCFIAVGYDRDSREWVVTIDPMKEIAVDNVICDHNDVHEASVRVIKVTLPDVPKEQEKTNVPEIAVTLK